MISGSTPLRPFAKHADAVREWGLWNLPVPLILSVLTVELTAVVLVALGAAEIGVPGPEELRTGLLLVALGALHTEIARRVEQVRRWVTGTNLHVNLSSVWFFAAAVLLPPAYAGVVAATVFSHLWWRSAGVRAPLHRQAFNTASFVLAGFAASASMSYMAGGTVTDRFTGVSGLVLVVGMLVFTTMNTALVAGAVAVSNPQARAAQMVGDWNENLLEAATLCMGTIVAAAITVNPWLALAVFPPLLVLHRAVLVRHLEEAASIDGKTGLLNAAAWHTQAERELRRVGRREGPRAVLVVDLDHFKAVNDKHGHLAGDQVLAAVADALRDEVRDRDLVGRFGGEEFVVLLGGLGEPGSRELGAVAERIRRRIAALRVEMPTPDGPLTVAGLSASVGGSLYPGDGRDLRTLLHVADTALYAAKRAGRNVVRLGAQLPIQTEHEPVVVHGTHGDHAS